MSSYYASSLTVDLPAPSAQYFAYSHSQQQQTPTNMLPTNALANFLALTLAPLFHYHVVVAAGSQAKGKGTEAITPHLSLSQM
jgi:hypothetical protein